MKIAITGGTGFIGKLLVEKHLSLGDQVVVLSRKKKENIDFYDKVKLHYGDLSDVNSLQNFLFDVDVLYHCAAEIRDEDKMKLINIEGTKNLIKAASGKIKHWVQLSSVGVYGPIYSGNITEKQDYNPINEYERTKLESDLLVLEASKNNSFTYAFVRPSNVFGSEMRNTSLFQLIKTVDKGFYFFVGSKGASANYVPVENVVEAIYLAGTNVNAKNQIYNISEWTTIEVFIGFISKELGKQMPKIRIPSEIIKFIAQATSFIPKNPLTVARVKALSNRTVYVNDKIETELGYKPIKTIETSVKELVNQYKKTRCI